MSANLLAIFELLLFFVVFGISFQIFSAFDLSKFFKKGFTWQIQIIYIFSTVIFSYLFTKAIVNLIALSSSLL
jgi:uncharacterized membrane protein YwzB